MSILKQFIYTTGLLWEAECLLTKLQVPLANILTPLGISKQKEKKVEQNIAFLHPKQTKTFSISHSSVLPLLFLKW